MEPNLSNGQQIPKGEHIGKAWDLHSRAIIIALYARSVDHGKHCHESVPLDLCVTELASEEPVGSCQPLNTCSVLDRRQRIFHTAGLIVARYLKDSVYDCICKHVYIYMYLYTHTYMCVYDLRTGLIATN